MLKYILLLFLLFPNLLSAGSCSEPNWLGICPQIQEHVTNQLDIQVIVRQNRDNWLKFNAFCVNNQYDWVYGYAHFYDGYWHMLTFGSAIDDDTCAAYGIPSWIR